jgi:hypothetical protein
MRAGLRATAEFGQHVLRNRHFIVIAGAQLIHGIGATQRLEAILGDLNYEAETARQLTADLQKAALNLMMHLRVDNFRIRIDGIVPAVYLTLGAGRSSCSTDSAALDGPKEKGAVGVKEPAHAGAQVAAKEGAPRVYIGVKEGSSA